MAYKKYFSISTFVIISITFFLSCEKIKDYFNFKKDKDSLQTAVIPGVCVGDEVLLKKEPHTDSENLSLLSLGETVLWHKEISIDSGDNLKEYLKVTLSDSTSGWTLKQKIVLNAHAGALKGQTHIFKRPDSITVTENMFQFMDMVAVTRQNGEWIEVTGKEKKKTGWIKHNMIAASKEDVASAIYARKKLREIGNISRLEIFNEIILNAPYRKSIFIEGIRNMAALEAIFENEKNRKSKEKIYNNF